MLGKQDDIASMVTALLPSVDAEAAATVGLPGSGRRQCCKAFHRSKSCPGPHTLCESRGGDSGKLFWFRVAFF
jgi:hypothetical protein